MRRNEFNWAAMYLKQKQPSPPFESMKASQGEETCSKKSGDDICNLEGRPEECKTNR
jgi:hypothetical protein